MLRQATDIDLDSTFPRDSYLITTGVWSKQRSGHDKFTANHLQAYPENVILGPTLFDIPIEELFFFIIQTYIVRVQAEARFI